MASIPVHHYLWSDYSFPVHRRWMLTLTDAEAIAFIAFVTTLVAYTQGRVWNLELDIFNRWTISEVQLPVDEAKKLPSQGESISMILKFCTDGGVDSKLVPR